MKPITTINILGIGRVSSTFAQALETQGFRIAGLYSRNEAKCYQLATFLSSQPIITNHFENLPAADGWIIGTSDDAIELLAKQLEKTKIASENWVLHFSGALSSELLSRHLPTNIAVASWHPMFSFLPFPETTPLKDVFCAIETPDDSLRLKLFDIAKNLQMKPFSLEPEQKLRYHAIGVFCANYLYALFDCAKKCANDIGLSDKMAWEMMLQLTHSALERAEAYREKGLTGPIARNDIQTLKAQYFSLKESMPEIAELYQKLAKVLLK